MTVRIVDCEQGTEEWHRARMGMPTASEFASILAKGEGKTRRSYMLRLAGEIITGEPAETYSNGHMERGKAMEDEARRLYCFLADADPERVGFMVNDRHRAGCSPDSLIGDVGILEVKTKLPHLAIDCILKGEFPPEHKAQCQGELWVAEREWIDLAVYWPRLPLYIVRATRDDAYIANLAAEVRRFHEELSEIVGRVRRYAEPQNVAAAPMLMAG